MAQRLFVEKAGLPSPLLNQIKRLAAFQNPEFYKRQRMRLSTAIEKRLRGYRAIGYTSREAPPGYGEPGDEVVVEYDEDVLRELEEGGESL